MSGFYEKCGDGAATLYVHEDQTNASSKTKNLHSLNYLILVRAETSVMNLLLQLPSATAIGLLKGCSKMPIINGLKILMSRCVDIEGTRGLSQVGPPGAFTDSYTGNHRTSNGGRTTSERPWP